MTAEQWTELLLIAGSIVAAILVWKMYQIRRAYKGAIECEGEVVSVTSYEATASGPYGEYDTTCFIAIVEFKLNGRKYDAPIDNYGSRQAGARMTMVVKPDDPWGARSKRALYTPIREWGFLLVVLLVFSLIARSLK